MMNNLTMLRGVILGGAALNLAACGGDSIDTYPVVPVSPPVVPVEPPPEAPASYFSAPQQIEGISIAIPVTITETGDYVFEFSLFGGFYYANGVLSVLPAFLKFNSVNADPALLGQNFDVYLPEFAYSLNGLTATAIQSTASVSFPGSGSDVLVVADFNGDGIDDVFIGDSGYDDYPFPGGQNSLLFGTASGGFVAGDLPEVLDFTHAVSAADIDGDGDIDIFVGNISSSDPVPPYFLINDGQGNFTQDFNLLSGLPGVFPGSLIVGDYVSYTGSYLGDVNNDGTMDLILSGFNNGSEFLSWNGSQFVVQTHLYLENDDSRVVTSVDVVDLNNDGRNEIILHSTNQSPTNFYDQDQIDILVETEFGTYELDQTILVSDTTWNIDLYVTDVNDDGFADLLSLGMDSKLLLNNNGVLSVSEYEFPFTNTQEVRMLDLNSDGVLDIIYPQFNTDQSTVDQHVKDLYVMFG